MIKTFPASLDQLYEMLHFIREQSSMVKFDENQISKIELAVEETLVNIISYGYPEHSGNIEIQCTPSPSNGIKIVIKDNGIPFNPLTNSKTFDPMTADQHTIGGYGIYFILTVMDEVDYKRVENFNILTLTKFNFNDKSG